MKSIKNLTSVRIRWFTVTFKKIVMKNSVWVPRYIEKSFEVTSKLINIWTKAKSQAKSLENWNRLFELYSHHEQWMHKNGHGQLLERLRTISKHFWRVLRSILDILDIFAKCTIHRCVPTLSARLLYYKKNTAIIMVGGNR